MNAINHATTDTHDEFPFEWQLVLLSMLLSDPAAWAVCRSHITEEYFAAKLRRPVRFICAYDDEHGMLPTTAQIEAKTGVTIQKFSEPGQHTEATIDEFEKFVRYKALEHAVLGSIEDLQRNDPEAVINSVQAAYDLRVKDHAAFDGIWIDECTKIEPPEFLIGPWLVKDTVTCVYGAPGSFKSFFCLEAAFRLATGTPFAGQSVPQTSVAYVAAEGQSGIALRLEALRERHGITPARNSMRIITQPVNLLDDTEVSRFIAYLKEMERREAIDFGLVVLDTYSQCIAGADENAQSTASKASGSMIRIRRELSTTVVYVHHTGKDASRGMRGSDALRANTDGAIEVEREEGAMQAVAQVKRAKDAATGGTIRFQMAFQPIARLVGLDINGSLVAEFPVQSAGLPGTIVQAGTARDPKQDLRDLADRMDIAECLSAGKACIRIGRYDTASDKQRLARDLPMDVEVAVFEADLTTRIGVLIRRKSTRPNDIYGQVTRIA